MQIAAGGYHSLALCEDDSVYGWGAGNYGENGNPALVDTLQPKLIDLKEIPQRRISYASFGEKPPESLK